MIPLRDYQTKALDSAFRCLEEHDSTLIVSPTGTGKTVMMAGLVSRVFPKRVMILAHREELIFQAKEKIERMTGIGCCVEMADARAKDGSIDLFGLSRVVVSSIQTQNAGGDGGRMTRFDPWQFDYVLVDEAHHAPAASYKRVLQYYRNNQDIKVIGVTATPDRADEEALGQVFASVAFDYEILDAINDGYLVPIRQTVVEVADLDFSTVKTTAGDLNGKELAAIMEEEKALHEIASPTLELAGNRKTLVFASSVKHAERLCEIFNRHEANAAWLCGKTPKDQRREILGRYAKGEIRILVNVGVLTEGFDDPGVEMVVIARPTKSRALYSQMVGRGTRPLPGVIDGLMTAEERRAAVAVSGKPTVEILDFAGNSGRHKLMTTADILGGKVSDEVVERAKKKTKAKGSADMAEELIKAEQELREEKEKAAARERAKLQAKARYKTKAVDPFDVLHIEPGVEKGWERGKKLTEKQANLLRGQGIEPNDRSYHENKRLLDELFRRWDGNMCSFKQARILQKYGYPTDCDRDTANRIIDAVAANGWRRPE